MKARSCSMPACQRAPAKKAVCCGMVLCDDCVSSVKKHDCPRAKELAAIAADPKKLRQWRQEHEHEERLTTDVIDALNDEHGLTAWRTKRRQGPRAKDELDGVLDIQGFAAPDGLAFFVETKRNHKDDCGCPSCVEQRDFAARASAGGCVVVLGVRNVQQAVDGVRLGLARRRGASLEVAAS